MTSPGNVTDTNGSPTSTNEALEDIWDDITEKLSYRDSQYKPNGLHTISALGDSLMAPNKNAKFTDLSHIPGDGNTGRWAWMDQGILLSGSKIYNRGVCATGGYTIQQIHDIHLPQVLTMKPDFCLVFAGQNDLGSLTDAKLNVLADIYVQLIRAGITPIPVTPGPGTTGPSMYKLINFVYSIAFKYDLKVFDYQNVMQDPATGLSYASLTSDGLHPYRPAGTKALAVAFANFINNELLPGVLPQTSFLGRNVNDPALRTMNNGFFGAPGTITYQSSKWDQRATITKNNTDRVQYNLPVPGVIKSNSLYRLGLLFGADVEQYSAAWAISIYSDPDFALLGYWDWQTMDIPTDTLLSSFLKTTALTTGLIIAFELQRYAWNGTNIALGFDGAAGSNIKIQQVTNREIVLL